MYLKNGLISFLKVKNVILLILGIFFTAASASNMIELIVYYFGDWFTIIHANSLYHRRVDDCMLKNLTKAYQRRLFFLKLF